MSKKVIIVILIIAICIILGIAFLYNSLQSEDNVPIENNTKNENKENSNINESTNKKIAIVYFSATGTTRTVAEYIKDETKGDIFEIIPKEKYTSDDLNYNNSNSRANKEQNDSKVRPEIANSIDISNYEVVFIGYPIWWGNLPRIIQTFMENTDLSGKTVIPFCTSGSSGISTSENTLKSYSNINWISGKRLGTSKSEVTNWINSLEI